MNNVEATVEELTDYIKELGVDFASNEFWRWSDVKIKLTKLIRDAFQEMEDKCEAEIMDIQQDLEDANSVNKDLEKYNDNLEDEVSDLENQIRDLDKELGYEKTQNICLNEDLDSLENEKWEFKDQIFELEKTIEELKNEQSPS